MTTTTIYPTGGIDDVARVAEVLGTALGGVSPNHGQTHNFELESILALKNLLGASVSPAAGSVLYRLGLLEGVNSGDETAARIAALIGGDVSRLILQQLYLQGMSKPLVNVTTPWLYAPSGTVVAGAAGGAYVTLALPAAIPVAGKVYLPAVGSLSAGWYDFYSATTGQVNLASAVASGGAYTATTGVDIVGPSYTRPGGALGPNGYIERFIEGWIPNTAGSKTTKVLAGAAAIWQLIYTTSLSVSSPSVTKNRNSQSQQQTGFYGTTTANGVSTINAFMDPAVDLSASTTISLSFRLSAPTDYFCLLGWRERATYGA